MSELIVRTTIDAIVGHRNRAVALYEIAFEKIREASEAVDAARSNVDAACQGGQGIYHVANAPEVEAFYDAVKLPDSDQYLRTSRRITDLQVWASVLERTDMDHLMDATAKKEFRAQMTYIPEKTDRDGMLINAEEIARGLPPVDADTIEATLQGLVENAGDTFRRGLARAFSRLDRRFRSHDGFGIGSRMILERAFDEMGHWNYHRELRDSLIDIERVFLVLDGKGPRATYAGIVGTIDHERKEAGIGWQNLFQTEHDGDYFRVRIYKNGNAHLWFTRKDLLEKVNKLLAEYYGASVADGVHQDDPKAGLHDRAVGHARNLGYFPTPEKVADRIIEEAHLDSYGDSLKILEPSAGDGALASRLIRYNKTVNRVHVIEIDRERGRALRESGLYASSMVADFLLVEPRAYDRVVMNPPFDRGRDVDHVLHAWEFVKPGGRIVAIMSAGTEFRSDKKTTAFRAWVKENGGRFHDLPEGSFSEYGTNVNTIFLTMTRK